VPGRAATSGERRGARGGARRGPRAWAQRAESSPSPGPQTTQVPKPKPHPLHLHGERPPPPPVEVVIPTTSRDGRAGGAPPPWLHGGHLERPNGQESLAVIRDTQEIAQNTKPLVLILWRCKLGLCLSYLPQPPAWFEGNLNHLGAGAFELAPRRLPVES
jgi:hypothetical protein